MKLETLEKKGGHDLQNRITRASVEDATEAIDVGLTKIRDTNLREKKKHRGERHSKARATATKTPSVRADTEV